MVVVPDNYVARYGRVQYNLMKKLGYTGGDHNIIRHMDWGYRNYHRQKPNDQFSSSIILKSSPEKPFGDKDGRIRKKDVMRVITELMKQLKANKLKLDKKVVYRPDRNNPMIEFRVDPKSVVKESVNENTTYKVGDTISYWTIGRIDKGKAKVKGVTKAKPNRLGIKNHYITNKGTFSDMEVVGTEAYKLRFKGNTEKKVMKAMGVKEGFGSDEFLTKTEKKKFEKERLENAEVLGYTLTGTKDLKESTIQEKTFTPIDKIKDIKNLVKKGLVSYRGTGGGFEISIRNKKVPGFPPAFSLLQKDEKKYKDIMKKQFKIKPVEKFFIKSNELTQLKKFGAIPFLAPSKKESVFAVRQDKIKDDERYAKKPNFDYDPEKGKSRIRKVNEKMRPAVKKLLKQKGYGPIFQAIDNSKKQFKQMRYSRGEIQDTLIDMFGKEDPKILQKIKESISEGKGVDKIMKMADDYSYGKIAGKTVDVMTAKLFQAVYKKASQKARDRVDKMNEKQLYIFMMNLWKKFGKQLTLST